MTSALVSLLSNWPLLETVFSLIGPRSLGGIRLETVISLQLMTAKVKLKVSLFW